MLCHLADWPSQHVESLRILRTHGGGIFGRISELWSVPPGGFGLLLLGTSQRESLEKQSRVSCQKRIGIHIPTGCGNVIQLPKEVIRHRSGGPQIHQRHQMREVWPGPKTRGQLGRCHGARSAYLGRVDINHRSLRGGMRWWPDFRHRGKSIFTILLGGQKFQKPPLHR